MIEKILSVKDEVGLHARPASLFVKHQNLFGQ